MTTMPSFADGQMHAVLYELLGSMAPGGKVVFIYYHDANPLHPLKSITNLVFRLLEPFAKNPCDHEIADFANHAGSFSWRKRTYFGGLFQKVVAERISRRGIS